MPFPVLSVAQVREWEKLTWFSGVSQDSVMRRAGLAVASLAERLTRLEDHVLFLAGKGHNGDDTAYAFEFIRNRRRELMRITEPEVASAELERHLAARPALIVDGLFGIGLNRPLATGWATLIERINEAGGRVLAVDVPSGLNADTGLAQETAIRAHTTLTFGCAKAGLIKLSAIPFVGRLEVAGDIGLVPCPFSSEASLGADADYRDFPPPRPRTGHKGSFGHLGIVAGSAGYHGAAVLAARGAQRAQPGLITLLTHQSVYAPIAAQLQSVMVRSLEAEPVLPDGCTAVLVGPGLAAPEVAGFSSKFVRRLWRDGSMAVIVDATALDWVPSGSLGDEPVRVITPHPGEAARMLQCTVAEVQHDRIAAARALSQRFGNCHVILKGHQTVTLRAHGPAYVNHSGNPYLAQGGSGDLLAGYLGGLLAQPELVRQVELTLRFAVWQHGAAGDALLASRRNFTVEELGQEIGLVEAH